MSTNHNLLEEKGEPKRNRADALLLASLIPYRWARPAHTHMLSVRLKSEQRRNKKRSRLAIQSRGLLITTGATKHFIKRYYYYVTMHQFTV